GTASERAGTDPGIRRQRVEGGGPSRSRNHDVAWILTLQYRCEAKPRRETGRHVLEGVHRGIHPPVQDGPVELLREEPTVPDARQGNVLDPVPDRLEDNDLDPEARMGGFEPVLHVMGLPEREPAAPGPETEIHAVLRARRAPARGSPLGLRTIHDLLDQV